MQNKIITSCYYTATSIATIKRLKIPNVGKDEEELESSYTASRNVNDTATVEYSSAVSFKVKNTANYTTQPFYSPRHLPKSKENMCPQKAGTQMFTAT